MKKILVVLLISTVFTACDRQSNVAATVDGKPVTMEELDNAFGGKVGEQIYSMRKNALDSIIDQKLLEQAAAEKKLGVEDFLEQEADSKVTEPTEQEIKTIYEANVDHYGPKFEEAKESIANALKRNRISLRRNQLLAQLREKSKIEVKLQKPPVRRVEVSTDDDPCLGTANAKVTIIEFSDYQCPFCGRARATVNQMVETYKENLRYCFRDFPLSFHQDALGAAVAAQCAFEQGTDPFWKYNKTLFENQRSLKTSDLKNYAKQVGLDTQKFEACLGSKKYEGEVQKDMEDGSQAGVSGTPAFFVNGISISGAQPFEKFKEVIDEELKK